jgi:hypothetical protein
METAMQQPIKTQKDAVRRQPQAAPPSMQLTIVGSINTEQSPCEGIMAATLSAPQLSMHTVGARDVRILGVRMPTRQQISLSCLESRASSGVHQGVPCARRANCGRMP